MRRRRGEGTIYKRKDGRFEIAIFISTPIGAQRIRRYCTSRIEADKLLVELRNRHQQGLLTSSKQQKIGEYSEYWLKTVKTRLRPSTFSTYESIVRNYIKPNLGQKYLVKLNVADVQSFIDKQQRLGTSNRTIQKQRLVLSGILKKAEQEELISRNVARLVDTPKYNPKEIFPWNLQQLGLFYDHAKNDPFFPIFVLLSLYGLRTSEALGLTWSDIDFDNKVIHIRQQLQRYDNEYHLTDVKTQAGHRELPLMDIVYKVLSGIEYSNNGSIPELVFKTSTYMPIDRGNLRRSFQRISKNADLPVISLHHLRHTAATILKDLGVPARDTQLILGHAHISTTQQIYQHADTGTRFIALERYEQKMGDVSDFCRQIKPSKVIKLKEVELINSGSDEWT